MVRLISDQNFNGRILRGLRRRVPDADIVRTQDLGLEETQDAGLLAWAATESRVLLTHDVNTVPGLAYDRVRTGLAMPGVFLVPKEMPIGPAIADLELALAALGLEDCRDQVIYVPL